jgi:phosphoribosylamine--glycine ligase
LRVFGPTKSAAELETSKVFAKNLMRHADIPSADFLVFDHPEPARHYVRTREYVILPDGKTLHYPFAKHPIVTRDGHKYVELETGKRLRISAPEPLVVKADGLAAGKGVFVCTTTDEALAAIERIMAKEEFGREAGRRIVIEKRLDGPELSMLALVAGRCIVPLPPTQDHKRACDDDMGPNTGGMGAYCPAPLGNPQILEAIEREVLVPTVHTMKRRGRPFRGILYAGLMLSSQGIKVLEFNCRFGDPEAQPVLLRLRTDLLDLFEAVVDDRLEEFVGEGLDWDPRPSVCVVMCSGGYPGPYERGHVIRGLAAAEKTPDLKVFHAGTRRDGDRIVTDGGRVLGVTALGDTLAQARDRAYEAAAKIEFRDMFYRKDIATKALTTT